MKDKEKKANQPRSLLVPGIVALVIMAFMTVVVVLTSVQAYYSQMTADGESKVKVYSFRYAEAVNDYFNLKMRELDRLAANAGAADTLDDALGLFQSVEHSGNEFKYIRYYKDGLCYDCQGHTEESMDSQVTDYLYSGTSGTTGIITLRSSGVLCVAFCSYVDDPTYFDMLTAIIPLDELSEYLVEYCAGVTGLPEFSRMMFCTAEGNAEGFLEMHDDRLQLMLQAGGGITGDSITNLYTLMETYSFGELTGKDVSETLGRGESYAGSLTLSGESYLVSVSAPRLSGGKLVMAQLYLLDNVVTVQSEFVAIIIMSLLLLVVIVAALLMLSISSRRAWIKKMEDAENFEPLTGCNTYKMFERQLTLLLDHNAATKFAVMYLSLTEYDILYENYGEGVGNEIISFCGKAISKSTDRNETYGHISDGKFVVALHYRDLVDLDNRMDMIYALVHNYNKFAKTEYSLSFTAGVYLVDRSLKLRPAAILSNAIAAQRSVTVAKTTYYCLYDEKIDEARHTEREIELRKDQALTNKEFLVYYQPKLNLKTGTLDGAEALVRWYYPETDTVYSPGVFMPIFEMDGFVEKLDRYVYLETLEFMRATVEKGQRICPISVNVSRVTALQPDFLYFYIENKRKYNIADGYIVVEFTESFAFDNNEQLRRIVTQLRENGIKCSIDDFGVGYSSYSILKELPMDEIKLDAFFIRKGYDSGRDEKTLRSIIRLGQDLGMKVTQEGVESPADKQRITDYGCDVLQGYCYSRPLAQEKFAEFLQENLGSHGDKGRNTVAPGVTEQ